MNVVNALILSALVLVSGSAGAAADGTAESASRIRGVQRKDPTSMLAHQQLVDKAKKGGIDVYFLGDSITRRWGATDYPEFLKHWRSHFHGWNAANFGWGGDTVENILWRIENGELEGVRPKVIVLLAGTNNVGAGKGGAAVAERVTRGIKTVIERCQALAPEAVIVLTAVFPRNDHTGSNAVIREINEKIAHFADGRKVRFLDINDQLATPDGTLREGMAVDGLHLGVPGYEVWANALKPILHELLGPPAKVDTAPAPTGDPSARK